MKTVYLVFLILPLYGSLILAFTQSYFPEKEFEYKVEAVESPVTYKYDRIDELKKECKSVLSSASELNPDSNGIFNVKNELFFQNGDWSQDVGNYPLLPFDNRIFGDNSTDSRTPLSLVSFWVTDVDQAHQSKEYVSVSGLLTMGKTVDGMFLDMSSIEHPQFRIWPSHSELSIAFQGIYTESKKNGGERVMCLLGNTLLPARDRDSNDPWGWAKNPGPNQIQPPLLEDDQILLVLHYPTHFMLTNMIIRGELRSLNPKSNLKYFDEVHILSQFGQRATYEFGSEKIISKACDPYPYQDYVMTGEISTYRGFSFCEVLEDITREQPFTVLPNWKCNGADEFCNKLGPFASDEKIKETDGGFDDVKLYMQNLKCEKKNSRGNESSARVSAVFRAVPPSKDPYTAAQRSGLSTMTLSAEGIWKSSRGQLCMLGCLGLVDDKLSTCNSRICLYIPTSFSIKQRGIIIGTISSINKDASYFPLSFKKPVQPSELWNYFRTSHLYYTYTKIKSAGALLEKKEPFSFGTVIKKSLLQFPKLEDTESFEVSLSLLSEDLGLHTSAVPDPKPDSINPRTAVQMEILSVGPLFGRYWSNASANEDTPYHTKAEYSEKQLLLNVSAQLSLTGKTYNNFSVLFLEGLYDPHVGNMYLVGCRDFRASWKLLFESKDLEAGLDCLINVVVSYPPTTSRWLVNPTAKISISSQRTEDDPLYFRPVKLQTLPIMYRKQREDILSRRGIEGILRILTLSFAIACISSQLLYIKQNVDSTPYLSLTMLGVQALAYSLPLVTDAEALFKKLNSESSEMSRSYDLDNKLLFRLVDYTVKLLLMVSFLLTLRLCQKVWKSRIRLLTRTPLEPRRVPSDKLVFATTFLIHLIGFIAVIIIHNLRSKQKMLRVKSYILSSRGSNRMQEWEIELEEYVGLVQDFFLLPQIIGNFLWQIDCKPHRKLYFIGITVVRLLPHIYDYIRAPVLNPYFAEDYEFVNPRLDFYSKFGDVAIPVTALILAVLVYIQQRWNYEKLSQSLALGKWKLLPRGSRMYERLPSKPFEAELASGVNGNAAENEET